MRLFFYILCFFIATSSMAQNQSLFEQGVSNYKAGEYQKAIANWKTILDREEHSAALYFNLGNAHYKLNNIGPSIYYYEKALQLDPNDSEVLNNLVFAENARVDNIEMLPITFFQKWRNTITGILSIDGWAIATVLFSILFVLFFLTYYFSVSVQRKRLLFVLSIGSVIALLVSLAIAFQVNNDLLTDQPAIVFAESSEVKNGPTLGSESAFVIHEGTKVQILETEDSWARIRLENGKDGWIPLSDIRQL